MVGQSLYIDPNLRYQDRRARRYRRLVALAAVAMTALVSFVALHFGEPDSMASVADPSGQGARDTLKVLGLGTSGPPAEPAPQWNGPLDLTKTICRDGAYFAPADTAEARLTLLPRVQQRIEELFLRYDVPAGGFVAVEVPSGRVVALVGHERSAASAERAPGPGGFALRATAPAA